VAGKAPATDPCDTTEHAGPYTAIRTIELAVLKSVRGGQAERQCALKARRQGLVPDRSVPRRLDKPDGLDFRLEPGLDAVDAGTALRQSNHDDRGKGPDIGAREVRAVPAA
jgi:hypothetical protein